MATFNLAIGGSTAYPAADSRKTFVITKTFDATVQPLAQNDIAQLINIPANTWVSLVRWEVKTVEGAARNFSIGDGVNASGFIASTSGNTLAEGVSGPVSLTEGAPNTVTGFSGGKYYPVADTLDLTAVTAGGLTACKIDVTIVMTNLNP